jgi:protein-arginine kinase activator protein McsA
MSCSIEMLPCEECGREVIYFHIRLLTDEDGERRFVCAACAGEELAGDVYEAAASCD